MGRRGRRARRTTPAFSSSTSTSRRRSAPCTPSIMFLPSTWACPRQTLTLDPSMAQYPSVPPKVNLMTTGGGRVRYNPVRSTLDCFTGLMCRTTSSVTSRHTASPAACAFARNPQSHC